MRNIIVIAIAVLVASCAKNTTTPEGATTSGTTRAVIKNGTTTVAHVVSWSDYGGRVGVYIPSVDRYAMIDLSTGQYAPGGVDGASGLYFSTDGCTGDPGASGKDIMGELGKAVLLINSSYYLVTAKLASFSYKSTYNPYPGSCDDTDGTVTSSALSGYFSVTPTTQPYDFTALSLPLTITYE